MSSILDSVEWIDDPRDPQRLSTKVGQTVVTVPKGYVAPRPAFCPVCSLPMRDISDILSYDANSCCNFCDTYFARPRRDEWKAGWRPSRSDIDALIVEKRLGIVPKNVLDG